MQRASVPSKPQTKKRTRPTEPIRNTPEKSVGLEEKS